jgi:hypothetical protein
LGAISVWAALCGFAVLSCLWCLACGAGRIGGMGETAAAVALGLATPEGLPGCAGRGSGPGRCAPLSAAFGSRLAALSTVSLAGASSAAEEGGATIGAGLVASDSVRSGPRSGAGHRGASTGAFRAPAPGESLASRPAEGTLSNDPAPFGLRGGPAEFAPFTPGSPSFLGSGKTARPDPGAAPSTEGGIVVGRTAGATESSRFMRSGAPSSAKNDPTETNASRTPFTTRRPERFRVGARAGAKSARGGFAAETFRGGARIGASRGGSEARTARGGSSRGGFATAAFRGGSGVGTLVGEVEGVLDSRNRSNLSSASSTSACRASSSGRTGF